jgi:hypothetical protein
LQEHSDIFPNEGCLVRVDKGIRTDCAHAWQLGRPLWAAVDVEQGAPIRNKAIWAARKLLCTTQAQLAGGEERKKQVLALLFSRVAGFVLPQDKAECLVASHMATALSYEDGFIRAQYMSEPALAEGAKHVMESNGLRLCSTILDEVGSVLSSSPPHAGDLGELAACALLLQTYDDCAKETVRRRWQTQCPLA